VAANAVKPNKPQAELLGKLYLEAATPSDRLPYSDAFERLYAAFAEATHLPPDAHDGRWRVWRMLCGLRKSGGLPRLDNGRPRHGSLSWLDAERRQALMVGYKSTGLPVDRLPYTAQFERLYAAYVGRFPGGRAFGPEPNPQADSEPPEARDARRRVYLALVALRKSGELGRKTGRKVE
jgi:hypothetical protein